MPVPPEIRLAKYTAKFDTTVIKSRMDAAKEGAITHFGSAVGPLVAMEIAVQGCLNAGDVLATDRVKYYNFAREIWTVVEQGVADPALTSYVVDTLKPKYVALNCTLAILQDIALTVFSITIPGP